MEYQVTHRMVIAAGAVYVILAVAVVLMAGALWRTLGSRYEPLSYYNPRDVVNRTVEAGTFIELNFEWCNDDERAFITSATAWQYEPKKGSTEPSILVPRGQQILELEGGCHERVLRVSLPETVTPGTWRIGGSDSAISTSGRRQQVLWFSETFEVTGGE